MHFLNSVYFPVMPAAALWFRFKPISCARVMYTNFPFLFVWSCAEFVRLIHTHTHTHSHTLGCEFQHFLMTFKWELRLISPACPKIEISQDRRTITASCFPGVSCQDGWESLHFSHSFPSNVQQHRALTYTYSILQHLRHPALSIANTVPIMQWNYGSEPNS